VSVAVLSSGSTTRIWVSPSRESPEFGSRRVIPAPIIMEVV